MMFKKKIRYHWKSAREGIGQENTISEHFRKSFCHRSLKKVNSILPGSSGGNFQHLLETIYTVL